MGIRFNCPNGHRLNVKSFLAGKRGFCPHCGVKILIPALSEQIGGNVNTAVVSVPVTPNGIVPSDIPEEAKVAFENAEVQWFVRPVSGGQYGPANDVVLAQWVEEGRIGLDTLLWRAGWESWKYAEQVLPTLAHIPQLNSSDLDSSPLPSFSGLAGSPDSEPIALSTIEVEFAQPRRRARRYSAALIAGLVLVSILLVVALALVAGMY